MTNSVDNLGDLSFTPQEADAIRQAEAGQRRAPIQVPPPQQPPRRRWWLALLLVVLVWAIDQWPEWPGTSSQPPNSPPPSELASQVIGITRVAVRLRQEPNLSSLILAVIPPHQVVTLTEERADSFYHITYHARSGYVAAIYLNAIAGVTRVTPSACQLTALVGTVRMREQASLSARAISGLANGTRVMVGGFTSSGWVLVETTTQAGFVWGGFFQGCQAVPFLSKREGDEMVVVFAGRVLRPQ